MLRKLFEVFELDRSTVIITCSVVAISSLFVMHKSGDFSSLYLLSIIGLYAVFMGMWLAVTNDNVLYPHDEALRKALIIAQYSIIIMLNFLVPLSFVAILVAPWAGQLPYFFSFRIALLTSPLWASATFWVHWLHWSRDFQTVLISSCLYWTLYIFALVMTESTRKEKLAREEANQLNRELLSTQALLNQATKQAERVRIARNIHDLLGHHLTALTINLQVASRTTEGDAKSKIDECHGLAKLLLSDVREAVSEIREKSNLELKSALKALIEGVPEVQVELEYDDNLHITDVTVAEAILRCVQESLTNSLKHSRATHFSISLQQREQLQLTMQDNGQSQAELTLGNGLNGIKERILALGGKVNFASTEHGFVTQVVLP